MSVSGEKDVSNLFQRVTALEQDDADGDQAVTRIVKNYSTLGIKVSVSTYLHQYRICGDTNPLYLASTATDHFL